MSRIVSISPRATLGAVVALAALVVYQPAVFAAGDVSLESPSRQAALLELYTSEGCSSCPPADRWISTLKRDERLWRDLVPVAFHVDYWDYIGWVDRFASPIYSARQRDYASRGHARAVYTPGLFLNGNEWRAWFTRRSLEMPEQPDVGVLRLSIRDREVNARFDPTASSNARAVLHLAVLGFDLATTVRAGENRGRELRHDFVVLAYAPETMQRDAGGYRIGMPLPETKTAAALRAVAGWVSLEPDPRPVQAVGGWLN